MHNCKSWHFSLSLCFEYKLIYLQSSRTDLSDMPILKYTSTYFGTETFWNTVCAVMFNSLPHTIFLLSLFFHSVSLFVIFVLKNRIYPKFLRFVFRTTCYSNDNHRKELEINTLADFISFCLSLTGSAIYMFNNTEKGNTGDKTSHQVRSSCAQTILLRTIHNLVKCDLKDTDTRDMQSHEFSNVNSELFEYTIVIFKKHALQISRKTILFVKYYMMNPPHQIDISIKQ